MKINTQHHQAINYLLQGHTGKETAAMLSVAPETVSKWRNDNDFQALINQHLKDMQEAVRVKLRHLSTLALVTVEDVMNNPDTPPRERLQASFKILELVNVQHGEIQSADVCKMKPPKEMTSEELEAELLKYGIKAVPD